MCNSCGCTPCGSCGAPVEDGVCSMCGEKPTNCTCEVLDEDFDYEDVDDEEEEDEDYEDDDDYEDEDYEDDDEEDYEEEEDEDW